MTTSQPVLVVGAGPVGQTAALLLARWGVPVIMLDARPSRESIGSKAICQQRDVLDVWDSVGAGTAIADEGVTWERSRTFYRGDELFCVEFADNGQSPFPPFVNISQSRTEEILDERIAAEPLIDLRWSHEVVALSQDGDGVQLQCRTRDGATTTLAGTHVLACVGAQGNAVRQLLGVRFDGRSFDDQFLICDLRTELPEWALERRFYFDPPWNPGRQVLIHPCPDSTYRIDWQVPDGFDIEAEQRSGALDRRVRSIIGDRDYTMVWQSVYRFHSRLVDRMRLGRVLLAGDAAHLVAPFGARGLNSGALDAENAAWKIAFVRNGWAPDALLDSYHLERRAAAMENIEITDATMRFLVPQTDAEHRSRLEILSRSTTDAHARAQVDSGRLAEPYWYVDSPLTTPEARRPFGGRPGRGQYPPPGPGVIVPDCPITSPLPGVTRLRQLARTGLVLLSGADVDVEAVGTAATKCAAPVRVHRMPELSPHLPGLLGARPSEAWLVRPDAHVAAVVEVREAGAVRELAAALDRALGSTVDSGRA